MKTPITDRYYQSRIGRTGEEMPFQFARRLELDRAALMEALEDLMKVLVVVAGDTAPVPRIALGHAQEALSAARANFPNED